jgi:hypothetical protein
VVIGARVEATFVDIGGGLIGPNFVLADEPELSVSPASEPAGRPA